ncbi:hypothetical protein D7X55_36540 [Corallococcus sp. AB049A]|uniref:trypsin-like serine protease n=1 Tax=Corallococcus sp. AB049A TaxID=2316721 RepID=UPI000EA291F1|nr:trypsin-like serine protease [Corallococcus sp. AB049A]RKH40200.1 hypothetical protein D7Y23_35145 [Corallococcus sp. AB050B]RKI47877.1 hypothetical protein D7X55_36540 [Corallococcus sp. AB049A]
MKLESARALKEELRFNLHKTVMGRSPPLMQAIGLESLGSPRERRANRVSPPDGVALGIVPGKKRDEFKLAVRLQDATAETQTYAAYVAGKARDEVDVRFIGRVQVLPAAAGLTEYQRTVRPLEPGFSVGHFRVTAGTIGGFVVDARGRRGILSNNHVLADSNAGRRGDVILQAGPFDRGRNPEDVVGKLERFIQMKKINNSVDAAYALLNGDVELTTTYRKKRIQNVVAVDDITSSLSVWKVGRTTGYTQGTITAVEVDQVAVNYGGPIYSFDGQLEIEGKAGAFSAGGDSGSFILDKEDRGVGLLFAGSAQGGSNGMGVTYANPLQTALELLGLELHE